MLKIISLLLCAEFGYSLLDKPYVYIPLHKIGDYRKDLAYNRWHSADFGKIKMDNYDNSFCMVQYKTEKHPSYLSYINAINKPIFKDYMALLSDRYFVSGGTIMFWIKFDYGKIPFNRTILTMALNDTEVTEIYITNYNKTLSIRMEKIVKEYNVVIHNNEWIHIALLHKLDQIQLYINGKFVTQSLQMNIGRGFKYGNKIKIGYSKKYSSFQGCIGDIRIYNTPVTECMIEKIYRQFPESQPINKRKLLLHIPLNTANGLNQLYAYDHSDGWNLKLKSFTREPFKYLESKCFLHSRKNIFYDMAYFRQTTILESIYSRMPCTNGVTYMFWFRPIFKQKQGVSQFFLKTNNAADNIHIIHMIIQTEMNQFIIFGNTILYRRTYHDLSNLKWQHIAITKSADQFDDEGQQEPYQVKFYLNGIFNSNHTIYRSYDVQNFPGSSHFGTDKGISFGCVGDIRMFDNEVSLLEIKRQAKRLIPYPQ